MLIVFIHWFIKNNNKHNNICGIFFAYNLNNDMRSVFSRFHSLHTLETASGEENEFFNDFNINPGPGCVCVMRQKVYDELHLSINWCGF